MSEEVTLQVVNSELERIDGYREIFKRTHPYPQRQEVYFEKIPYEIFDTARFVRQFGKAALGFALAAICGAIFSAIRTALIFITSEKLLLEKYGYDDGLITAVSVVAGVCILFAIEGYLAAFGFEKGRASGKVETDMLGLWVAMSIAAIAGVISSFEIASDSTLKSIVVSFLTWSMVFLSGPGVSWLVYLGTHNMGILDNQWNLIIKESREKIDELNDKAKKDFDDMVSVLEAKYIEKRDLWEIEFQDDYRKKGRSLLFGEDTFTMKRQKGETQDEDKQIGNASQLVHDFLQQENLKAWQVGRNQPWTPTKIAQQLNIPLNNVNVILNRMRNSGPKP